jgi:predicted lipoprotein with Yx(FWY)xxD motif
MAMADGGATAGGHRMGGRRVRAAIGAGALALSAGALGVGLAVPAASAHPTMPRVAPHAGKAAVVVKISAKRGKFKNVLTNTAGVGATLYTAKSCTGGCLTAWPPLLMPKGTTVPEGPKGLTGLATKKDGTRLQVTYKTHPLYTFTGDSGTSVNGNGLAGFTVIANA